MSDPMCPRPEFLRQALLLAALGLLAGSPAGLRTAGAAEPASSRDPGIRIYRALDRNGNPAVVLTNLDEDGNPLPGAPDEPQTPPSAREATRSSASAGDGSSCGSPQAQAERSTEPGGGTTVVININNQLPASSSEAGPSAAYALPVFAYGGIAGPFRYPENHHFLGYGPGIGSPSFFGGLGLNPGNRFGGSGGAPCGKGFDCMFGPDLRRP